MSGNLIDNYLTARTNQVKPWGSPSMTGSLYTGNKPPIKPDSVDFLGMSTDFKCTQGNGIQFIQEGKINDQDSFIKTVRDARINGIRKEYHEGYIGNKKIALESYDKDGSAISKNYVGTYNNKSVDLTIEYEKKSMNAIKDFYYRKIKNRIYVPDNITVKGTIDGKPYEINMPNAKVPRNSDEKDLVALLLHNEDFEPATINGEIKAIQPGVNRIKHYRNNVEKRNEMSGEVKGMLIGLATTAVSMLLTTLLGKIGKGKCPVSNTNTSAINWGGQNISVSLTK